MIKEKIKKNLANVKKQEEKLAERELNFVLEQAFPHAALIKSKLGENVLLGLMKIFGNSQMYIPSMEIIKHITDAYFSQFKQLNMEVNDLKTARKILKANHKKEKLPSEYLDAICSLGSKMNTSTNPPLLEHLFTFAEDKWPEPSIYNITAGNHSDWVKVEDYEQWKLDYAERKEREKRERLNAVKKPKSGKKLKK